MVLHKFLKMTAIAALPLFATAQNLNVTTTETAIVVKKEGEKDLYIPKTKVSRVPDNNDYNNPESAYSFKRFIQGPNVAIFWHKEFGDDPMSNPNEKKRFDVKAALPELERFYDFYVNTMKLVPKGKSYTDKYKAVLYVIDGDGGTAFGGGATTDEAKIGMLWTPAARMSKAPYGALAHELGHSFQFLMRSDFGTSFGNGESMAQLMLWNVYPEWMTFENYHLVDFMKATNLSFGNSANQYHTCHVYEYWSNKYGIEFYGNISRFAKAGEDQVQTYKRFASQNQEQFNAEMFDACRRFITWDIKRIEKVAHQYANQHHTTLNPVSDGWFRIAKDKIPMNYGYNGIKLNVPANGTTVSVDFKGLAGTEGYSQYNVDKAGWRYGFVASLKNGDRVYSDVFEKADGKATFKVPKNTEYLWLVVMGAPTEHFGLPPRQRPPQGQATAGTPATRPAPPPAEEWPYQIKLTGTTIDDAMVKSL